MPDQVIDFNALDTIIFDGVNLTELIIDGISIWPSLTQTWPQIGSDITGTGSGDGAGISVALNDTGNIVAYASPYNIDGGADSGEIRVFERIGDDWTQVGSDIEGAPGELATRPGLGTHCVALNGSGDVLATSWPGNDEFNGGASNNDAGQVRVYKNVSNTWTLTGGDINALASDTRLGAYDGLSLNTEGNIVAVGGWLGGDQPDVSDPGVVRVYEMVAGTWSQLGQTLSGETTGVPGDYNENADYFGYSVRINSAGNIIVVGGWANDNNDYPNLATAGHVRVFENISGTWTQIGSDIDGGSAGLTLGRSVSINNTGNIVAAGGYGSGAEVGTETGVIRVFENIAGTWTQIGSDITGVDINDRVGYSVELNGAGDTIAIGEVIHDSITTSNVGRMRIFKNIDGEWVQHADDISGSAENEYTGWSVALNNLGDVAAVGSPGYLSAGDVVQFPGRGSVRVYGQENVRLRGSSLVNSASFNVDGSRVVINSPRALSDAGEVYVSEWTGTSWSQLGQTIEGASDAENSSGLVGDADRLGSGGLNSDGSLLLTLAEGESSSANKGKAQVYQYNQSTDIWETYGQAFEGINGGDNLGKVGFISANGEDILIYTGDTDGLLQRYHYHLNQWDDTSQNPLAGIIPSRRVFTTPDLEYIVYSADEFSTLNQATIYKWQPITTSPTYVTNGRYNQHGTTFTGGTGDNLNCTAISPDGQRVVTVINSGVNQPGRVTVYEWSGTDWSQIGQTIIGLTSSQNAGDGSRLGVSAAINGDLLILGEPAYIFPGDNTGDNRGRLRFYQYDNTTNEFKLIRILNNPNSDNGNESYGKGLHLSTDGSTLLVNNFSELSNHTGDIYNIDY